MDEVKKMDVDVEGEKDPAFKPAPAPKRAKEKGLALRKAPVPKKDDKK